MHSAFLLPLILLFRTCNAYRFQLQGRRHAPRRRGNMNGSLALMNTNDVFYLTNLTLGGDDFLVVIDTRSSDLWVSPPNGGTVPNSADTGHNTSIVYVSRSASGSIKVADMAFAGFTVKDQPFLEVPAYMNVVGVPGVIGLGFNTQTELDSAVGHGPLDRIFLEDLTIPNYITFLLGRSLDDFPGDMTVGSVLEGYEAVLKEPQVPLNPC
ncbi:hypothetical protein BDZ89DRAFT_1172778 [Hymenopellis radicata]|nr:hypothetical protein BDZ89DRAFT_1172778 [Hymenopellis radicata]